MQKVISILSLSQCFDDHGTLADILPWRVLRASSLPDAMQLLPKRQISVITKIQSRINLTLEVRGKTVQAQGPRPTVEILRHEFRYRLSSLLLLRLGENVGNFSHECPGT